MNTTTQQTERSRYGLPERDAKCCNLCDASIAQGLHRCTLSRCHRCHEKFCGKLPAGSHGYGDCVFVYARKNGQLVSFHNLGGRRLAIRIDGASYGEIEQLHRCSNIWNAMERRARDFQKLDALSAGAPR